VFDCGVVDIEMGDHADLRQVADRHPDLFAFQVRLECGQLFGRHVDEHHVAVLRADHQPGQAAQTAGEACGAGMILGQAFDVVIERMQARGSQYPGLPPAATGDLAPASRLVDQRASKGSGLPSLQVEV